MIFVVWTSKLLTFVDTFTKSAKTPEFSAVVDLGRKEAVLMPKSTTAENSGVFTDLVKVSTKVKSFDVQNTNMMKCSNAVLHRQLHVSLRQKLVAVAQVKV